jgi:hypothetical protein
LGAHVIIDARTKKVRASFEAPGEGTTIFAIDLIGDTWEDFLYFREQARSSQRIDDLTKRFRYVRAATAALFSHLEGVISDVFGMLREDGSFAAYRPKNPDRCSLKSKVEAVHNFLVDHRGLSGAAPPLELKLLRDILNHPTITKKGSDGGSGETVLLDGSDVYGIAVEELDAAGQKIDHWLNVACATVPYERFLDTKRLAEEFARALSSEPPSTRRF